MLQGLSTGELFIKFLESSEILLEEATEGLVAGVSDRSRSYLVSASQVEAEETPESLTKKLTSAIEIMQTTILDAHYIFFKPLCDEEVALITRCGLVHYFSRKLI